MSRGNVAGLGWACGGEARVGHHHGVMLVVPSHHHGVMLVAPFASADNKVLLSEGPQGGVWGV